MKVLKDNYTKDIGKTIVKPYPRTISCENCGSSLEYEESDLRMGEYGCMYLDCPLCGYDNMLEDNENSITLTKDNIEFPVHFHYSSIENGAVDTCNNEYVKDCIRKAIDYFRKNKDATSYETATGNTTVCVFRYEGDENYEVVVANDYYHMCIPFEPIDY